MFTGLVFVVYKTKNQFRKKKMGNATCQDTKVSPNEKRYKTKTNTKISTIINTVLHFRVRSFITARVVYTGSTGNHEQK